MAYYVLSCTFFAVDLEQFFLFGVGMLLFSFAFRYTCSAFLQKEKITEHLFVKFTADHLFTGCSICLMLLMSLHQIVPVIGRKAAEETGTSSQETQTSSQDNVYR